MPDGYLTTQQAADQRGVDISTVRRWCVLGLVECLKLGRDWIVDAESLAALVPPKRGPKRATADVSLGGRE